MKKKRSYYVAVDTLLDLMARVESGKATLAERDILRSGLNDFRNRLRSGNLSQHTARRLGLIDANGNAL